MPFVAQVFKVLIASPGDTAEFRDAVEQALRAWNSRHSNGGPLVLPQRWELDGVPESSTQEDGQEVINRQLVDGADIVLGIFHGRLGSATPRGPSGTAEELTRSMTARKKVHVFFCEASLPYDHDRDQFAMLGQFRTTFPGLPGRFRKAADLKERVQQVLASDLADLVRATGTGAHPADAGATPSQLEILSARFGVGEDHVSVTRELRQLVEDDQLMLRVETAAFTRDPAPGKPKYLALNYTYAGKEDSRVWREGETLVLPLVERPMSGEGAINA